MPIIADKNPVTRGTMGLEITFKDEADAAVVPKTQPKWTLTDEAGNVINNKEDILTAAASTVYVTLSGDDLDIGELDSAVRYFIIETIYDSITYGTDLPLVEYLEFTIVGPGVDQP